MAGEAGVPKAPPGDGGPVAFPRKRESREGGEVVFSGFRLVGNKPGFPLAQE